MGDGDYDREWFALEGREIETLVAECRKDPSADIWAVFQRVIGRLPGGSTAMPGEFSTAHSPDKQKRPGRGAIRPQDRRSGRTLGGSFCSTLAAPWGADRVVQGAGVTDREGSGGKEARHDGSDL